MTRLVIFAFLVAVGVAVIAAPAEDHETLGLAGEGYDVQADGNEHLRFRRVTCDLLSFGGVVGDSACAANCLSMGKAGGSCNSGICECRKTKLIDLWNSRFGK